MSDQNTIVSVTQAQLAKMIAEAVGKLTVAQTAPSHQVAALPTGKPVGKKYKYTEYSAVLHLKDENNPSLGFVMQTTGAYAGRPKAFGFKKQNRKEVVITWPNGAEVRFMVTQDSPKVHDSRTPTMRYDQAHVISELKRVIGDDSKAISVAQWLADVVVYDKVSKDPATLYGKCKVAGFETYRKVYGKKAKQPRETKIPMVLGGVTTNVQVDVESAEIPF